jgi:hypothetical protein
MDLWKVVDYLILGPRYERPLLELAAQKQLKSEVANTVSGVAWCCSIRVSFQAVHLQALTEDQQIEVNQYVALVKERVAKVCLQWLLCTAIPFDLYKCEPRRGQFGPHYIACGDVVPRNLKELATAALWGHVSYVSLYALLFHDNWYAQATNCLCLGSWPT